MVRVRVRVRVLHYYASDNVLKDAYTTSHWHLVKSDGTLLSMNPCLDTPPRSPPSSPPPAPPLVVGTVFLGLTDGSQCNGIKLLTARTSEGGTESIMLAHDDDTNVMHPLFQSHAFLPLTTLANISKDADVSPSLNVAASANHDQTLKFVTVGLVASATGTSSFASFNRHCLTIMHP